MLYGDKSQSLGLQKAMFFAREHKKKLYPIEISVFSTIKNLNTNRVGIEDLVVNDNNTVDTLRIDYLKKPLYMEIEETVQKALVDIGKTASTTVRWSICFQCILAMQAKPFSTRMKISTCWYSIRYPVIREIRC